MIQWLRSLIFFIGLTLLGMTLIPIMQLVALFIPRKHYRVMVNAWCRLVLHWFNFSARVRYEIQGIEHLEVLKTRSAIIVSNHQSTFETFFLATILPEHAFVLKKELLRIPIFGWGLARLNPIAIDRTQGKTAFIKMLKQTRDRLKNNICVVIFPQGTRTSPHVSKPYKSGAFVIATKLKAPILPISHNSGLAWSRGKLMKTSGTIKVTIGPLIECDTQTADELKEQTQNWIESHFEPTLAPYK